MNFEVGDVVTYNDKHYIIVAFRVDGVLCVALREVALWDNKDSELEGFLLPADKLTVQP